MMDSVFLGAAALLLVASLYPKKNPQSVLCKKLVIGISALCAMVPAWWSFDPTGMSEAYLSTLIRLPALVCYAIACIAVVVLRG